MAGGAVRQRGIIAEINVTPLVDIMLVLLIIFMLTAHLLAKQAIEVELPRASQSTALPPTTLAITRHQGSQAQAIVAGDKKVSHGRVVEGLSTSAIAALKACRFTPGQKDGQSVPVRVRGFKIRFLMEEGQ